jgi:hypothetical protein
MFRISIGLLLGSAAFCADVKPNLADMPDPLAGAWSSYEISLGNTYPGVFTPFSTIGWTAQMSEGGRPYRYFRETIQGSRSAVGLEVQLRAVFADAHNRCPGSAPAEPAEIWPAGCCNSGSDRGRTRRGAHRGCPSPEQNR